MVTYSRFGTVAGLNRNDGSSDEEEGQAFYAGGSEHSGQQVIGPGKKKKDIVAEMFKSVQE
jgi:UBX domain-containing protein 1